jgi:amino acid adenylation domain-containing protein
VVTVNLAGELLSTEIVNAIYRETRAQRVYDLYGPTEDTTYSTYTLRLPDVPATIGRPIANTQAYVLDGRQQPVPIGVPGELYLGGDGLARGYLNRPQLTAEKFIRNPFSRDPLSRLYRTGDLARWREDGNLECLGRIDHQVKLRGFRIELGEIEAALRQHPQIRQSVVLLREDKPGEKRLVAYFVPETSGTNPTNSELRRRLEKALPEYMVPATFVRLEDLPLTPNGKVNRQALPAPDSGRPDLERSYVAPRTHLNKFLAQAWCDVMRLERVGIHDNFFELGGHSLLAMQIVSRVRSGLQIELSVRALFEAPTVAGLAERIENNGLSETARQPAVPLQRVARDRPLQPSFAQERLWFFDQLEPGSAVYNIPRGLRLCGPLNLAALERSLLELVGRHEVLRTTFATVNGQPQPVVLAPDQFRLVLTDLRSQSITEREAIARRLATEEARRPFDLSRDLMLRAQLLRLDDQEHWLLWTMHHIASDGWSLDVFERELAALYEAYSAGRPFPLPELPVQYADYAAWQREWLQGEVLDQQLTYWKTQLADAPGVLELPTDYPRPVVPSYQGAAQEILLDEELTEALEDLSRREMVTPFMTLLAAFQLLLSRYSGQEDISVGAPIAGRSRTELEGLIGFFVNTLVLRTSLSGNPTFRELLARVREVTLGAYAHQELPFERLVMEINPPRTTGRHPLCDVLLNYFDLSEEGPRLRGIDCELLPSTEHLSKFWMTLYVLREQSLHLQLVYRTEMFSAERMHIFLEQFRSLLFQAVTDPDSTLDSYTLCIEQSQHLLPDPTDKLEEPVFPPVTQRFREWAERTPRQIAIERGQCQWTYEEIRKLSANLDCELRARQVRAGDIVALYGQRSLATIVSILGILSCGGVLVIADPDLPAERREVLLQEAAPRAVVCTSTDEWIEGWCRKHEDLVRMDLDSQTATVRGSTVSELPADERPRPQGNDSAYLFFTSGTTGTPQGVLNRHKGLSHFLSWQTSDFFVGPQDRVAQLTGLSFDVLMREVFLPLTSGGTLSLPKTAALPDPEELFDWLARQRISILHVVPSLVEFWLDRVPEQMRLPELRLVFSVGEPLTDTLVERLRHRLAPHCQIVNLYGAAETGPAKCAYRVPAHHIPGIQPVGGPIPNTQALIVAQQTRLCGIGEIGEIAVRSPFLAQGYLKENRNGGFSTNPFRCDPSDRMYFTGDLGRYRLDGSLEVLGRNDDQVKIRGVRVEPAEVTAHLMKYPGVQSCAVVPIAWQHKTCLVAYIIGRPEFDLKSDLESVRLRSYLANRVSPGMVPAAFVMIDALPLTPNGKIDRRALPVPTFLPFVQQQIFVAPGTPVEIQLADIWREVLGLERVGLHDNFFDLGGHSLLATQLISRVRNQLVVEIPLRTIFEMPTIADLAQYILERQAHAAVADGMEALLAELESLSEESAAEQLRELQANTQSSAILAAEGRAVSRSFRCPTVRSEWFGQRKCNLLIVLNERYEFDSFERVAKHVHEFDPQIEAVVIQDQPSVRVSLPPRPTLIFSPTLLRHRPPLPGPVFCGCPLSKSEEYAALERAGIPVPKWVILTEDRIPDLHEFDDYVVRKPDYGGLGAEVKLVHRDRVRWKKITTRAAGPSLATVIQQFIYTGRRPVSYRVKTLFGHVLYSTKSEISSTLPELGGPEDFQSRFKPQGGTTIVASARGSRVELNHDEEVIRFAERAHAAFPEIPLLGFDIVREIPSGKLFVLEANAIGWVWNFNSFQPKDYGFSFEEQFNGVRKAAYVLAEKTQQIAGRDGMPAMTDEAARS